MRLINDTNLSEEHNYAFFSNLVLKKIKKGWRKGGSFFKPHIPIQNSFMDFSLYSKKNEFPLSIPQMHTHVLIPFGEEVSESTEPPNN